MGFCTAAVYKITLNVSNLLLLLFHKLSFCLPSQDFQNFVTKLDEILVLKSKCIQTMRAQLQLYLSSPSTDTSLQTPPPV